MSRPFEKFVIISQDVNTFSVRVASPEFVRGSLQDIDKFQGSNSELSNGKLMMERYLFIEDAIREKLERF